MKPYESLPTYDKLLNKIYAYYETIWKDKWKEEIDQHWLGNFKNGAQDSQKERLNMLFLLSKFMYFGNIELRQLLLSLYRDLYKYPIVASIRKANNDTRDIVLIEAEFKKELTQTRFLGVGNPSESGVHLLYYFRQECDLSTTSFMNTSDIFSTTIAQEQDGKGNVKSFLKTALKNDGIRRYVFIDDFCGSGQQVVVYLKELTKNIKFADPSIQIHYLMLFGTEAGIDEVRKIGTFDTVEAIFTIDESFKAFSDVSRYFAISVDADITKAFSKKTALKYGANLASEPLGHNDCQLLFGLFHNTPDNTLPIFWSELYNWSAIFKRYLKF
ncbi:MAG TPA: hypothetical protein VF602_13270 [Pedobacter sp.]|jgi:hypothetical protein